jgi:choline dehydrogenase
MAMGGNQRVVIIGAGTGGCALAGHLARLSSAEVTLLEAGPDYGPFEDFRWPTEFLDTRRMPTTTHDWGLKNEDTVRSRTYPLERAKVIGGCSSHNGCSAVRGTRLDYARWAKVTQGEWAMDGLEPDFEQIERLLNVRTYSTEEITPFQRHVRSAAINYGLPVSGNINDLDEDEGVSVCPVNKRGGFRWNAAFAFLDPVRFKPNFRIVDGVEIDSLQLVGRQVTAAKGMRWGTPFEIKADVFVAACGAYGTPLLLQRSGIGNPKDLSLANIEVLVDSPGVGGNLQDHPTVILRYAASPDLISEMKTYEARNIPFEEGIIIKKRSSAATNVFDLHIFSSGGHALGNADDWYWELYVGLVRPKSRGAIVVAPGSKGAKFKISHNHFSDKGGADVRAMLDGVRHARGIAAASPLREFLVAEKEPGAKVISDKEVRNWIQHSHLHYWHPAGTCRMGPHRAQGDVCSGRGQVHGLENLFVADTSLMPEITGCNTNVPTALIGWRVARIVRDFLENWRNLPG